MAYLQDNLQRWSAYIDIANNGNAEAATGIVTEMLRNTESTAPATAQDGPRLWPLALAYQDRFKDISGAFVQLGG
jgi:hypothetical protein